MSVEISAIFKSYKGGLYEVISTGKVKTINGWIPAVTYRSQLNGEIYTREKVDFLNNFNFIGMINVKCF